jgi:predicted ATPase
MNFSELTLLMGPNGGGKSTLFDLLYTIRRFIVDNAKISETFPLKDLTAWVNKTHQTFELDVVCGNGIFSYKLIIAHNPDKKKQILELEQLTLNGKPLFEFNKGNIKLYNDNHEHGSIYPFDLPVSALGSIGPRSDNKKLTWFKKWMDELFIFSLQPKAMTSESSEETGWFNRDGSNFASWYRYISQEHQDKIFQLMKELRESIHGFHAFKLKEAGRHKILRVGFTDEDQTLPPVFFDFEQLSDGQRVLIVLYSLLFGLTGLNYSLFIDEPENYISLPEIQPWLMALKDACGDGFRQTVLISHHPELIDYLGPECGKWIERDPLGPARVKKMPEKIAENLKLSEHIARGWTE